MDTHNKKTHTDKRTLTLEEKEARILASIPKKYLTKKGKIRILGDSEIDRLIKENPELFKVLYPLIMKRLDKKTSLLSQAAIIVSAISILLFLIKQLILK